MKTIDTSLTFRIGVWRPWLLALTILAVPLLIAVGLALANGVPQAAVRFVTLYALAAATLLVPIGITTRTGRWDVDACGIGGPDKWHVHRHVRWGDIESVSRVLIPGYTFGWVNTAGRKKALWVPLFLTEMHRFRRAVEAWTEPGNPLREFLGAHPE